jgi:hypothetical protein
MRGGILNPEYLKAFPSFPMAIAIQYREDRREVLISNHKHHR